MAAALRAQMDDGTLKHGGDVVSIVEVIGAWAAAPSPVTQAVQDLAREGRLIRYPGYGYIVPASPGTRPHAPTCRQCGYTIGSIGHATECGA